MSQVRRGLPGDLPALERLRRAVPYPGSVFFDEATWYRRSLDQLREVLERYEELPDWRVLVLEEEEEPVGYLVLMADDEHGVTHQLQAIVQDFAVFSHDGLAALVEKARRWVTAFENEYLLVELPPEDKRLQLWFYRCGFRPEQTRAARFFPRGHRGASSAAYPVRAAREDDLPFLLEVHAAYPEAYRPAGREVDMEAVEFRYQLLYAGFDMTSTSGQLHFILEEASTGRAAGYMIVQEGPLLRGEKSFYVYDVAVAPAFAGRGLSLFLIGFAESLAGSEGGYLYGDGSLGTKVIASWHAQMGYTVESVRFALDVKRM